MNKFKKSVSAVAIALGISMFGYGCNLFDSKKQKVEFAEVYDKENKQYLAKEGGIDEIILNGEIDSNIKEFFKSKDVIDLYEKIDYYERELEIEPLDGVAYSISKLETDLVLLINTVDVLESRSRLLTGEPETSLDEMLSDIRGVAFSDESEITKLIIIYSSISEHVQAGENTPRAIPLTEILETSKKGDCNDIAPAYAAIFSAYGFESELVYGIFEKSEINEEGGHVWIRMNVDGHTFDLDPTWYPVFTPLEPRDYD